MGLTKKQKRAWKEYGEEAGVEFADIEEVPPEFGTPEGQMEKLKTADITKRGGYEEIPEMLVAEAVKEVGLRREDIPPVAVEEVLTASLSLREGETTIVIPRRLSKRRVPETLKHEFTHYELGHQPDVEETYDEYFTKELQVDRAVGPVTTSHLVDRIFGVVDTTGLSWREAIDVIAHSAREVGVSEVVIRRAKKWVRNYVDRYGLDLGEGRTW